MSEEAINDQLVLIGGKSSTGKSASLRNIRDQASWMYLGTEAGKRLPFRNTFDAYKVTDPYQVTEGFDAVINGDLPRKGIIVDSLTFLMDQYETQYVVNSANTMGAWGNFQQYFKILLQEKTAKFQGPVIYTAHVLDTLNEATMTMETGVPIKGAIKNQGVEAYFSTIVHAERVDLKDLRDYENDMLNITPEEEDLGYKHVFQTRPTRKTIGKRIRAPMDMFSKAETYIDNDAQILLDHMKKFYG